MGLFDGTRFERPVTCEICGLALSDCRCPRDASGKVLSAGQQTASIRLEKRPGGKQVTVVAGLDPCASDLAELLRQLQRRCAAGGTVQAGAILLQGDHRESAGELLTAGGYRVKMR